MAKSAGYMQRYRASKREPKIGEEVYRSDWFRFDLPSYAMQPSMVKIIGESQSGKAWKVDIETWSQDGETDLYYTRYIPKAAIKTKAQVEWEDQEADRKFQQGQKKYAKMVEWAQKKGIKGVRVGLRKETILKKIKEAGYNYRY